MSAFRRHQLWQVKLTPAGEFVSAVYECLLCDKIVLSHNPTCAMMQVCQQCAQKEPTRPDIDRIFQHGFDQRRAALVEIGWPFPEEAELSSPEKPMRDPLARNGDVGQHGPASPDTAGPDAPCSTAADGEETRP